MILNPKDRFGSAKWATEQEIRKASLFSKRGIHLGVFNGKRLRHDGDGPILVTGGARSGKLRDFLGYVLCDTPGMPMLVNDPRGELAAISMAAHTTNREHVFLWNPMHLCGLYLSRCNPLDLLEKGLMQMRKPVLKPYCLLRARGTVSISRNRGRPSSVRCVSPSRSGMALLACPI